MWANAGRRTPAPRMASHTKAEANPYLTNSGSSRMLPKAWATTKELRMVAKELDGKPTVARQSRPKDSKFQVFHCHSKEMQQLEYTRMRSGGQKNVSKISI